MTLRNKKHYPYSQSDLLMDLETAHLRLAFYIDDGEAVNELQAFMDDPKNEEEVNRITKAMIQNQRQCLDIIDKSRRRVRRGQLIKVLPNAAKIAACLVLTFYITLTAAIATNEYVRVSVMELLYSIQEQFTTVELREAEEEGFLVPAEWQGHYYPAYVPEGYSLSHINNNIMGGGELIFRNQSDGILRFNEYTDEVGANIDSEDASVRFQTINSRLTTLFEKDNWTYAISCWFNAMSGIR